MNNELYHHGVKGMKWGVRKDRTASSIQGTASKGSEKTQKKAWSTKKKALVIGGSVAAAAVLAYGGYKTYELVSDKQALKHYTETGREAVEKGLRDKINTDITSDVNMYSTFDKKMARRMDSNRETIITERMKNVPKSEIDIEAKRLGQEALAASKRNRSTIKKNARIRKGRGGLFESPLPAHWMSRDPRKHYVVPYDLYKKSESDIQNRDYVTGQTFKGRKPGRVSARPIIRTTRSYGTSDEISRATRGVRSSSMTVVKETTGTVRKSKKKLRG